MTSPAKVEFSLVNAFTVQPFTGNPAAVVLKGDTVPEELMLKIAGEANPVSETVFVCTPTRPNADLRLRYFTSSREVDLCGHATIAALFCLAWSGQLGGVDETIKILAETSVGVLQLGITFEKGVPTWARMEQLKPRFARPTRADLAAEILGINNNDLSVTLPVECANTGIWACFVPLKHLSGLGRIRVDRDRIEALWPENPDLTGVYPFAFVDEKTTQGRFFSPPKYGIVEDPVTGTACGALGGYLIKNRHLSADDEFLARQGFEMGRGGSVRVSSNPNGRIVIRGQAVAVIHGQLLV